MLIFENAHHHYCSNFTVRPCIVQHNQTSPLSSCHHFQRQRCMVCCMEKASSWRGVPAQQSQLFVNSLCCRQSCHARTVWQAGCCNYGLGLHTFQETSMHLHSSCTVAQIKAHGWTPLLWQLSIHFELIKAASWQARLAAAWLLHIWNAHSQDQALLAGKMA